MPETPEYETIGSPGGETDPPEEREWEYESIRRVGATGGDDDGPDEDEPGENDDARDD
jgi:hypothetical protein